MSPVIKILLVTGSYPPMRCGVGDYTERLARALSDRSDIKLSVLTSKSEAPSTEDPSWLKRTMTTWRISALPHFFSEYRAFKPDIVHVQFPTQGYRVATGPALIPLLARWLFRTSVVETWHEYPPTGWTKAVAAMWGMAIAASAVVFVRPDYLDHVDAMLGLMLKNAELKFIANASAIPVVKLKSSERADLRTDIGCDNRLLVSFFGFAHPHKCIERLFEIADPRRHHLLLITDISTEDPYHIQLRALAESDRWRGKVTITGFVEAARAARLLAISDAAVFPFEGGGGAWNSSLHAATSQGIFTIVTSLRRSGYVLGENVYYAAPGGNDEMRAALDKYAGSNVSSNYAESPDQWMKIASAHLDLYRSVVRQRKVRHEG